MNEVTVHYQLLPKNNPEDQEEVRRYSCSECPPNIDVFNTNVHAQIVHNTLIFDVDPEERARDYKGPTIVDPSMHSVSHDTRQVLIRGSQTPHPDIPL